MVGTARLRLPRAAPAVVLPVSSVVQRAAGTQVVTLKADSTLAYCDVTLGRNLGNEIEVLNGIQPGDIVVLAPNALLADGNKVNAKALRPVAKKS